jgi:hypothetical protein
MGELNSATIYSRDRANKRRELRAQYLIDAYRKLEGTANRGHVEEINEGKAIMESAFADIQLFGSASQVAKAQEFLRQFSANKTVQMNELLADLRQDLRNELDLDSVSKEVLHLRIRKSN